MYEYNLTPDPMDFQIIRFNNCVQCLSCICDCLAIFIDECRTCADAVRCFAYIVWMVTSGCMGGQIAAEKWYQMGLHEEDRHLVPTHKEQPPSYVAVAHDPSYGSQPPGVQPPPVPPPPPPSQP